MTSLLLLLQLLYASFNGTRLLKLPLHCVVIGVGDIVSRMVGFLLRVEKLQGVDITKDNLDTSCMKSRFFINDVISFIAKFFVGATNPTKSTNHILGRNGALVFLTLTPPSLSATYMIG